jgi:DNA-binding response OmpR family regulator
MTKLLLVEDDQTLREMLAQALAREGYEILQSEDGLGALDLARTQQPELILLDIMLPGMDGLSVCRTLRRELATPIVLLTALGGEVDRIVGLDSGADDYVVKPFALGELLARLRAVQRRGQREATTRLQSGDLVLELLAHRAFRAGQPLNLSPREFELLTELIRNKGTVLTRDLLLERIWGIDFEGDSRAVDVYIHSLRDKIEPNPESPERILTVRGIGYRFEG